MKLFRRKSKQAPVANIEDVKLPELAIIIDGKAIKPLHNQRVLELVAWEMQDKPYIKNQKETNMIVTNAYVYHSLKEGATEQNISFPYTTLTLFHLIDLEDYGRIIDAANKTFGLKDENYNSGKLKTLLN